MTEKIYKLGNMVKNSSRPRRLNLRNVVAIAICLAGMIMFWGCEIEADDPSEPGNNNGPGNFTKKTLETYQDLRDFIPPGIYHVEGGFFGDYILGCGNDGSFVFTLRGTSQPVETFFDDRFFYLQWNNLEHTWYKTEVHHLPEKVLNTNADFLLMTAHLAANMLSFIKSEECEIKPKSITDETMAGVKVKHYVYEEKSSGISLFQEFWIMENGLCLKKKLYHVVAGATIDQPLYNFTVTISDTNPGDFKGILSKFPPIYVGGNQPEKLPAYDNIHRMQFKDYSDKWRTDLYPRTLDKWIKPYKGAGPIESTIIYRYPKDAIVRDNKVFKQFDFNAMDVMVPGAPHQDILNYINEVKTIEQMKEISVMDYMTDSGMYFWEGNNRQVAANPRLGETLYYVEYKIVCWGKAQYQISISVGSVTGV